MGLLEKRIKERLQTCGFQPFLLGEIDRDVLLAISLAIEEMRKDIESNATFASKELMVIDRKKWLKWFGAEPLLTPEKVEEK